MKKLLVTGGAGFIGSNFVRDAVLNHGADVVTVDALTYAGNPQNLLGLEGTGGQGGKHRLVHKDIRDKAAMRALVAEVMPDALVHFAAESHVDRSIDGPDLFVDTNVMGTLSLLNAVRSLTQANPAKKIRFLHVSTDEVFGSLGETGYFTESSQVTPNSPYSASKAASDHLARAFHHTYGMDVVTTNCSNNYGPYQFPEKLLPLMICNALEGKALPVYGDGKNRRDWIYVGDHCAGIRRAILQGKAGEVYLLGGRAEVENLTLVHMLCDALEAVRPASQNPALSGKAYRDLITFVQDRPGHDRRYAIDPSKAERELGFQVQHTLEVGLKKTVAWYLEHQDWCADIAKSKYQRERLGTVSESDAKTTKGTQS
jgi:dTDP-glucose 4,6-dehydratase